MTARLGALLCASLALGCLAIAPPVERLRGPEEDLVRLTAGPFFIQMSDPQMGFAATPLLLQLAGLSLGDEPTPEEIALFERAVDHANALKPDFVVITGDLINEPADALQTETFQRIVAGLDPDIPLHLVPGTHDVGGAPTPELLAWYRETFGPDWYSFRHGSIYGIVLNSSLIHSPLHAQEDAEAQLDWLEAELARAYTSDALHIVVFQHHAYFLEEPEEDDAYFNLPRLARRVYLQRLRDAGVEYVFAGHYHGNAYAQDGRLQMITTGPVGKTLRDDPSGFRIVRVRDDRLEHHYFGIAESP
jgi:3',5'-cyclic AMP phosphodiesterase CpdA